ncbi:Acyl-CoA dehydrogenase, middle domain [Geosmithia morbida]|uniref:Acyl-CoA dehydrogenase, middle domain n=1 Tax=Geosmithia morbida TaxID=1094350 RepID=A0A9P4Z352_9HYPO|nr:Acyl-CoA dehydrogenase, middle domain [Geosmithia morbida]KAF4125774.1 Acyl-CoA dehydrogenase, middle domain [Geosmithia morbida]
MMEPSGADKGFFQQPPVLDNHFYDETYQRCFTLFLPDHVRSAVESEVASLGRDVISDRVFAWITDAELNKPYLKGSGRQAFGQWSGELITGQGWRELQKFGIEKGFIATGYDTDLGRSARSLQFLRLHLWEPSCANVTCPSAMQDGAARLLQLHLTTPSRASRLTPEQREAFDSAYRRLTSRDPEVAWTSGQWMTERTGGSDVSLTETTARHMPDQTSGLGPWSISGFKWFSSATDSDMTVLLARTAEGRLSTFMAPMRVPDPQAVTATGLEKADGTCLNGVRIQRLKNKVGTRSLPTAELVLDGMRAWMVGEEGRGIHEISTILSITRIHSAVTAVGYASRGIDIAKAFAQVREIGTGRRGRARLDQSPLHMRTLSGMVVEHRGLMLLTFLTSHVLGVSEHPDAGHEATVGDRWAASASTALSVLTPDDAGQAAALLRVLTPITKAYVCRNALSIVFGCMESLGGVGYLDNSDQEYLNISRIWRDCAVLPIWEGTTDVLSTDLVRALKHPAAGKDSLDALEEIITNAHSFSQSQSQGSHDDDSTRGAWDPVREWRAVRDRITTTSQADLTGQARDVLWDVAQILIAVLLDLDASRDGNSISRDVFTRSVQSKFGVQVRQTPSSSVPADLLRRDWEIVYGRGHANLSSTPARL